MAQQKRKFVILFDYESKPKTKQQVFAATRRTCQVILQLACQCEVAVLPGMETLFVMLKDCIVYWDVVEIHN